MFCRKILGSRILRILDTKSWFHRGILEILDLNFMVYNGILEILDPNFLLCREILNILDPDSAILPWDPTDIGSWHSISSSDPADLES